MVIKNAVAIITARGGSKRIPKKNIRDFCGKPIIEYSIQAAIQAGVFDEVMVSTDNEEIASIARKAGAVIPFMRSEEASNDYATTTDVIMEVLEKYQERGIGYRYACCLYPTAPFITAERVKDALSLLREKKANAVMPVVPFSFPPQRCMVIQDGELSMKWPEYRNSRSQDLESLYHDCGQFYWYDVDQYLAVKGKITKGIIPIVLSELEVQDIDNLTDWEIAEMKYKILNTI